MKRCDKRRVDVQPDRASGALARSSDGIALINLRTNAVRILGQLDESDLTRGPGGFWHCNGSPDGRWAAGDTFAGNVWLIDRRDGQMTLLSTDHKMRPDHCHPTFSRRQRPNPHSVGPFHEWRAVEHRRASDSRETARQKIGTMRSRIFFIAVLIAASVLGCGRDSGTNSATSEIVLYSSIDEPYLTPLLKRFEQQTRIHVRVVTDTEATKSAGWPRKIEAEKDHPQADVYWGNEIFHTISLAERGSFRAVSSASAEDVPARWRGKDDLFACIGLRARMIVVSNRSSLRKQLARFAIFPI
jgi:hypothetical protein